MEEGWESFSDSMICDSDSRLVSSGFTRPDCVDEYVMFVNAGDEASNETEDSFKFLGDSFYEGGNVFRTEECIIEGGQYPFIYSSVRLGNFNYKFGSLFPGDYFVDLHFSEIIHTNGPKGMRVFNVYIQEEKVLLDFDIFAVVGANKPLQLVDSRTVVKEDGVMVVRFEGINGSPVVSGIGIRRAPKGAVSQIIQDCIKCQNCASEIELSSDKKKLLRKKLAAKYEKKIQELSLQYKLKEKECYEAWMSVNGADGQLEKVRMELDNMTFKTLSQDQILEKQGQDLRNITNNYEHDKMRWAATINDLDGKINIMKKEHSLLSCEAHNCVDSIPELNKMVYAVQALVAQCEELKMKYSEEQAKRKKLFNEVQETKGNIRVFCRCRPPSKEEITSKCTTVVDFDAAKDGLLGILASGSTRKSFKFDRVYTPQDDQAVVFEDASSMVISVLDGYNVCIFAYGQTGTGKTFTMEGTEDNRGVNYRTLEQLFKITKERSGTHKYEISVSVLEVYNEQLRDLLAASPASKKLEIKQASEGFHHVPGIIEAKVDNIKDVWSVLQAGSNARATGSNNVNEHSSRSHCLLCASVRAENLLNGECTRSKLWLVDLAGSERLAKTDVQGERLKEAQNINRSLSALGDVISALASKNSHIPYRNSKLTHLLQDSLGGDSKTLMFVQISPSDQDVGETLSSLNFATRVRGIVLGPAKRQIDSSELQKCKAMLDKARQESRSKDEAIKKLDDSIQCLESKTKTKDQMWKNLQEKNKELEGQLEMKINLHNQSEKQVSQLADRLKGSEEAYSSLQKKIKEMEIKMKDQSELDSSIFQQKVNDLEKKLKQQAVESEAHSMILEDKVKELDRKLKEKEQDRDFFTLHQQAVESEAHSMILEDKVKELDRKLKEKEQDRDFFTLHQKIKELEEKIREQEQQLQATHDLADAKRSTPCIEKPFSRDEFMAEIEPRILGSSNWLNRPPSRDSLINEPRQKREFRSGETENNGNICSFKSRKSDPTIIGRVVRTAKSSTTTTTSQVPCSTKRTSRDHGQLQHKERDSKRKLWLR